MLSTCYQELQARVQTIESALRTSDALRELLANGFDPLFLPTSKARDAGLRVKYYAAPAIKVRELDHRATMTILYAAYERFVYDLLTEWLAQLPDLYTKYSDLSKSIRVKHREGIAHVLLYIEKWERYKKLSTLGVIGSLATALADESPYLLLPEAFFTEDQNLRKERLEAVFASVGLGNPWGWIEEHHAVVSFMVDVRGEANTVEKELLGFIQYRNDAAHGLPSDILGLQALLGMCQFVLCICQALTEFVRRTLLRRYLEVDRATVIGRITEVYRQGTVVVGKMKACKVAVREKVYLIGKKRCPVATIQSLMDNNVLKDEIAAVDDQEVGLSFDVPAKKKLKVVIVRKPPKEGGEYNI